MVWVRSGYNHQNPSLYSEVSMSLEGIYPAHLASKGSRASYLFIGIVPIIYK